jgi:glycerophosphoryl diester phosphodiesterase
VDVGQIAPDQAVFVVGEGEAFGDWDASKAKKMHRKAMPTKADIGMGIWEVSLQMVTGVAVNYKYVIIGRDRRVKWESGKSEFRTVIPSGFETVVVDGAFGRETDEVWVDEGWLNSDVQLRLELGYYDAFDGSYTPPITGPLVESLDQNQWRSPSPASDNSATSSTTHSPMSLHFFDGNSLLSREVVPLPVRDKWTEVVFHMADLNKLKITVEVYDRRAIDPLSRYAGESQSSNDHERLARTCITRAILKEMRGICSVPLFNSALDHVGTLNFKYLVVTPFSHSLNNLASIWKSLTRSSKPIGKAVGHRGSGSTRTTFISENTILSFLVAADYGADYVEFDVQITNEGVPVINHDFHIPITSNDGESLHIPVSSLNRKQFKSLRPSSSSHNYAAPISTILQKIPGLKRSKSMTLLPKSSRRRSYGSSKNKKADDSPTTEARPSSDLSGLSTEASSDIGLTSSMSLDSLDIEAEHAVAAHREALATLKLDLTSSSDSSSSSALVNPNPSHGLLPSSSSDSSSPLAAMAAQNGAEPVLSQTGLPAAAAPQIPHHPHVSKSIINPHDRFATLDETLRIVPAEVGFVIEVKYPAERFQHSSKMRYAERNAYADAVLTSVFNAMHNPVLAQRKIMLISFDPDLCVLLSQKQPRFPVLFLLCLSHGIPVGEGDDEIEGYDPRCQSLEVATRFARNVRLQGLICDATSVLAAPETFVSQVHDASLLLMTYGAENMDSEKRSIQKTAGVDSLIMDNVVHINRESRARNQVSPLFLADYGRQHYKIAPSAAPSSSSGS